MDKGTQRNFFQCIVTGEKFTKLNIKSYEAVKKLS